MEMKEMGLLQQQKPEGQVVVEKPDNSGEDSGSCTTVVNGSAARQQQNYSFDSVRTDSGCGSSIANAGSVAEGAAFNGNSGGNSSGSNSSGSGGGGGGGGAIILPPQAVIVIQHHHPLPPQQPQQHLSSPSGYGHQLHGSSSSPSSTMTPTPAASTASSASSAASSSTLKSSTFELPPLHSIMDRMWRRDLGSSNTHLLASSGNNSCESLPYSQWASPMHSRQQQQQQQQQYHQHLQQQQHLSGDFTLPRNYPGGIHQNPAASMGFPSAAVADSLLDSEDSGRLLYMARHQHQHPQLQQQQQQQPDLLRNHQARHTFPPFVQCYIYIHITHTIHFPHSHAAVSDFLLPALRPPAAPQARRRIFSHGALTGENGAALLLLVFHSSPSPPAAVLVPHLGRGGG